MANGHGGGDTPGDTGSGVINEGGVNDPTPCGSSPDYITTVIQTRMLTVLGNMGIDCSNVERGKSPCDIWEAVLSSHRPAGCVVGKSVMRRLV